MLILEFPEVITISKYMIVGFEVDLETNMLVVRVVELDVDNNEVGRKTKTTIVHDDLGVIISPSIWGETDPDGGEIYNLLQRYLYGRLQDLPGESGLGLGTIV